MLFSSISEYIGRTLTGDRVHHAIFLNIMIFGEPWAAAGFTQEGRERLALVAILKRVRRAMNLKEHIIFSPQLV